MVIAWEWGISYQVGMFIKHNIKFLLHKRKPGDVSALSIRMRVTLKGQRPFDFPMGCKVDADKWNAETERVIEGTSIEEQKSARETNRLIEEYKAQMNEVFARYELLEKRIPTPQEVKDLFNDMIGKKSIIDESGNLDFYGVFDLFTEQAGEKNQWTSSTFQKFNVLRNHLKAFSPNLSFASLTEEKMQDLVLYYRKRDFRNTTISKQLSFFRWFLRWAAQKNYYNGDLHVTFKPKLKGVSVDSREIIYLSQDELRQLQDFSFQPMQEALERVRDVFLFQCFTGLRYSDVAKLKRSDVKKGIVHVITKKTVDGLRIELNKHSQAIIDKYKDFNFPNDKVLPVISNEKMNAHLKTLGQVVGLDEPTRVVYFKGNQRYEEVYPKWYLLTTHVARRTFVVTALQLGIPVEVIMRWTGHNNFDAMKPYAKIVDELKEKSMSKFDLI